MDKDTSKIPIDRKKDHLELAFKTHGLSADPRFDYEPIVSPNLSQVSIPSLSFAGKQISLPIWVSSMTGGTGEAGKINKRLARACSKFGMGMALGSCRTLLKNSDAISDFDLRDTLGEGLPFFANLGIAQVEQLIDAGQSHRIIELVKRLRADGLIIHINPLQEWLQPEGDEINIRPLDTIKSLLDKVSFALIVKEVGQGMGPRSMKALMELPLEAIEFAAHGGTNFALMEMLRNSNEMYEAHHALSNIGHTPNQMIDMVNNILAKADNNVSCKKFIISGGISDYLSGYYYINKINASAIYGQASSLLKYAMKSYDDLCNYIEEQEKGLKLAYQLLHVKKHE